MAHSPRGWTGARTPQAIKRVRQAETRRLINQPRRTAAKTLAAKALVSAGNGSPEDAQLALARAVSALDRAAKAGVIHPNAASRRKSRLTLKFNASLGGEALATGAKATRTTGKTAAAKQARARIAAGKAVKAKGAQTAAGKARAALARTTREAGTTAPAAEETAATTTPSKPAAPAKKPTTRAKTATKPAAGKATAGKATTGNTAATAKPRATKTATKKS